MKQQTVDRKKKGVEKSKLQMSLNISFHSSTVVHIWSKGLPLKVKPGRYETWDFNCKRR